MSPITTTPNTPGPAELIEATDAAQALADAGWAPDYETARQDVEDARAVVAADPHLIALRARQAAAVATDSEGDSATALAEHRARLAVAVTEQPAQYRRWIGEPLPPSSTR